jgi:hypothetical protein
MLFERKVGEHCTARIVGTLPTDVEDIHSGKAPADRRLTLIAQGADGEEKTLFSGIVKGSYTRRQGKSRILELEAVSYSSRMDADKRTRTFQDEGMAFSALTSAIERGGPGFSFIHAGFGDAPIGPLLVQYEETDWQFVKRVASRLGACVVSGCALDYPCVAIGVPKRGGYAVADTTEYDTSEDLTWHTGASAHGGQGIREGWATNYVFESRETYDLCDAVMLNGSLLYVYDASSRLKGSDIVHRYTLREKASFATEETFNRRITGASLGGTVREVGRDAVRVEIDGDIPQTLHKWFPYSTVYSSPDGAGWYFMPEVGDRVRLRFPNKHESEAFVVSSVHQPHRNRSDPDVKHITTKHGKTVTFEPDSIYISNGVGESLELHDSKGISITTGKDIVFTAGGDIRVRGRGKVVVQGDGGVSVTQNGSVIDIGESIELHSDHVRLR